MYLQVELEDEVLVDVLCQSIEGGFDKVEQYVEHLLTGIAVGTVQLSFPEVEETPEPVVDINKLWVTE